MGAARRRDMPELDQAFLGAIEGRLACGKEAPSFVARKQE